MNTRQCFRSCPPPLSEHVQFVVERHGCSEADVYDTVDNLLDRLHQPNAPVFPPLFQEEYYGVPGQFHRCSALSESHLRHTNQSFPYCPVQILLPCGLSKPHLQMLRFHT